MHTSSTSPAVRFSITVIMLFQVSALFVREFARRQLIEAGTPADSAHYQSAWAGFVVLMVLAWPIVRDNRVHLVTISRLPRNSFKLIVLSVAIGLAMRVASRGMTFVNVSLTSNPLSGEWFLPTPGNPWQCVDAWLVFFAIATLGLMTPVFEELINRGIILDRLLLKKVRFPILVSAFLFAILHRPDSIPIAFLFGIVVAVQMLHCRSLWGPVITHATANGLTVIDYHCFAFPVLDVIAHSLPRIQLALLGITLAILFFYVSLYLARRTGADVR